MNKETIEQTLNKRPRVYAWTKVQQTFLWCFVLAGITSFAIGVFKLMAGVAKVFLIEELSKSISHEVGKEHLQGNIHILLVKSLGTLQTQLIIYILLLSLSCFIIARYCQKVLNRNRYILQLEQIIKEQIK